MSRTRLTLLAAGAVLVAGGGVAALALTGDDATRPARRFTTSVTNPWFPLRPGTRWVYRTTSPTHAAERDVVTVTHRTRRLADGVRARIVRDVVSRRGVVEEATEDLYAQDGKGNVHYLAERTTEYEHGKPASTEGSFEAGKDGARGGLIMPADPRPGMRYRQEDRPRHAEDSASIVSRRESASTPLRFFPSRVLMTREVNPLDHPPEVAFKFYARGIGPVLELGLAGSDERTELVAFRAGD